MSTLPPQQITEGLNKIINQLPFIDKPVFKKGHSWMLIEQTKIAISNSTLSKEDKLRLTHDCDELKSKIPENLIVDTEKYSPKTFSGVCKDFLISTAVQAFFYWQPASKTTIELDVEALGLGKGSSKSIPETLNTIITEFCKQLAHYQDSEKDPPEFMKTFYTPFESKWILNDIGLILRKQFLTQDLPPQVIADEIKKAVSLLLPTLSTLLVNIKKASETGELLPQNFAEEIKSLLSATTASPNELQTLSAKLSLHFLSLLFPHGQSDIVIPSTGGYLS